MESAEIKFNDKNINYNLDNIRRVLAALGNPEAGMNYIHVAGTNGKGSVCAFLSSMLVAEGYCVGRFNSPFLIHESESISIGGRKISRKDFKFLTEKVGCASDAAGVRLTGFETLAAIAFIYFKKRKCDISVVEAGMGGRNDATNVIDAKVCVITGIAMDHTEYLGSSMAEIAVEKAAIVKKGGILVANVKSEDIKNVIKNMAAKQKANGVVFVDETISGRIVSSGVKGLEFYAGTKTGGGKKYETKLAGDYQFENALTALCAIYILNSSGFIKASENSVAAGIKNARWPARFEIIKKMGRTIIVDGAHNVDGVTAFVKSFKTLFPGKRASLITGILKNKEYKKMLDMLLEIADGIMLCDFESRGEKNGVGHLYDYLTPKVRTLKKFDSYTQALECAFALSGPGELICVTGSLYLAGPASHYLKSSRFNFSRNGR